ncbi:aldo/keto reductase [Pararhizobium sp. IMCC21322]|uniref:aldo/keto reductase n=1 Tax=Pararhizobium sp. IMCC21322 TaxID=3067903 RepID=UPI0027417323|nr:aldo/keto reductase [Pararhizobium sp. IMCC21322]
MKHRQLLSGLTVSPLGLGCMGMSEFYGPHEDAESLRVLHRANDLGLNFLDTADTYGSGHNEELVGRFLHESQASMVIASKFGIVREPGSYERRIDNSDAYIKQACEASLSRLGVECIDLYYAHRLNPDRPVEDTMESLSRLVTEGKVGHIGLCEVSADTLRRAHAIHPVAAIQTEYSLWTRHVEEEILPTCRELGVGFVPYSPLGRGYLTGTLAADTDFAEGDFRVNLPRFQTENMKANRPIIDTLHSIAKQKDATAAQIALAWLLAKGEDIVPIPGTKRMKYLEENTAAAQIVLTLDDIQDLDAAGAPELVVGERYTEEGMKGVEV